VQERTKSVFPTHARLEDLSVWKGSEKRDFSIYKNE